MVTTPLDIGARAATPVAPGPLGVLPGGSMLWFRRHPHAFRALARYGDVVQFRVGPLFVILLNHPDHVRELLVMQQKNFVKGWGPQKGNTALGSGLLTNEGDEHRNRRRLIQPGFHRERLAAAAVVVAKEAARAASSWSDGQAVRMHREMLHLTMTVAAGALLGSGASLSVDELARASDAVINRFSPFMFPYAGLLRRLPLPGRRRSRKGRARLDDMARSLIAERRLRPGSDLLSMLIAATDEQGEPLSDAQIRDELVTFFIAGHETAAVALTWTWRLLAKNPGIQKRMQEEVDTVTGGRLPEFDDLPRLRFTEAVLRESMRLFPPKWMLGRRALSACTIGGFRIPAGALVLASPYVIQRDKRFYDHPESFDPDRWATTVDPLPFSYFPFGGGGRRCVGEGFAWMEGTLTLATLAQKWTFNAAHRLTFDFRPSVILRPRRDDLLTAQKR
ncbi:MAG: cytochrome P450 [Acidobacteriota bacterium]